MDKIPSPSSLCRLDDEPDQVLRVPKRMCKVPVHRGYGQGNRLRLSRVKRDLTIEERTSDSLPSSTDELESDWVPRLRSTRRVCDSEESVRVVVEVERLMEVMEDLGEDPVREDVEVGGRRRREAGLGWERERGGKIGRAHV